MTAIPRTNASDAASVPAVDAVGLPTTLMFALLASGSLFGFVGLLIAVPIAATIGVLIRFALSRYMQSPLYLGPASNASALPKPDA